MESEGIENVCHSVTVSDMIFNINATDMCIAVFYVQ